MISLKPECKPLQDRIRVSRPCILLGAALEEKGDGAARLCRADRGLTALVLLTEAQTSLNAHSKNGSCAVKSGSSSLRLPAHDFRPQPLRLEDEIVQRAL